MADKLLFILSYAKNYPLSNVSRMAVRVEPTEHLSAEGVITKQPKKKPRGCELPKAEKETNRELSRVRVVIEHLISGAKRLRIVKEERRLKVANGSDDLMEIACGMHNLRNLMRKPFFKWYAITAVLFSIRSNT